MADRTFSFDRIEVFDHIQLVRSTEIPVLQDQSIGSQQRESCLSIAVATVGALHVFVGRPSSSLL
jgi:hypothetical protein